MRRKANPRHVNPHLSQLHDTMEKRLQHDVFFLVECSSESYHALWGQFSDQSDRAITGNPVEWEELGISHSLEIGKVGDEGRPVMLHLRYAWVEGRLIGFWHMHSAVQDFTMAEAFLKKHFTKKWDHANRAATCDASNFHHCLEAVRNSVYPQGVEKPEKVLSDPKQKVIDALEEAEAQYKKLRVFCQADQQDFADNIRRNIRLVEAHETQWKITQSQSALKAPWIRPVGRYVVAYNTDAEEQHYFDERFNLEGYEKDIDAAAETVLADKKPAPEDGIKRNYHVVKCDPWYPLFKGGNS